MDQPNPLPEKGCYWVLLHGPKGEPGPWVPAEFNPQFDERGLLLIGDDTLCMWSTVEELGPRLESPADKPAQLGPSDCVLGRVKLHDVSDRATATPLEVLAVVEGNGGGVSLHVEGYGLMETGFCGIVYLEYYSGEARLVVFGDINEEDPTHIISLAGARESKREED